MATQRLPVPGADDDQWGTILNGFLRVLHAENGGIQQWANDSARPTNPDEGETGINLKTGLFEAYQGGKWVELTKDTACACSFLLVDSVFADLPNVDFAAYTTVIARGYWSPNDWGGGVFVWDAAAADKADGGRYFKSSRNGTNNGRWVRKLQDNVNVLHYGAVPNRKFLVNGFGGFSFGGVYAVIASHFTSKPLSTKFSTLSAAQAWYGAQVVTALSNEIDYCAIQATLENNIEIFIPEGAYTCNQAIKMVRKRKVYGVGEQTILHFKGCSGFVPRQTPDFPGDLGYVYQDNFYIGFMHLLGDYVMGNALDDSKCGINFPKASNISNGYSQTGPLGYLSKIEHVAVSYFAGHGVKCLEQFNCAYDFVSVHHCGGHGIYLQGGNTTSLRGCYPANCGAGYASYRIIGGATLISCNGNDTPKNWWGSFGGTPQEDGESYPNISLIGCNLEGAEKCVRILGGGQISFENCYFQARITAAEPYFIFDEGYATSITLINNRAYPISGQQNVPAETPLAFIKQIGGNSGRYIFIGNRNGSPEYQWLHRARFFDNNGNNIYGPDGWLDIPGIYSEQPTYAVYAATSKAFAAEKFYVGPGNTTAQILSGNGSPQGVVVAPVGSMYLRRDGGANTTLYVKESGTGSTGWAPK
jgi:hypothetical protein